MGAHAIPYEPYHPHLWYTLAISIFAWGAVGLYSRLALRGEPQARVALIGLAIGLPLFAEIGSYLIFLLRPSPETPLGALLSSVHIHYLQPLPLDSYLTPSVVIALIVALGGLLIVSLARLIVGSVRLEALLRLSEPFDVAGYPELHDRLHAIADEHRLRLPPIHVLPLDQPLAFTIGLLHPRIYVADGMLALLDEDEAVAVFCHELAHVRRYDNLWNWVVRVLRDMAWFMPFSLAGWRLMVLSQDEACDAYAVRLTGNPLGLARALVKVAGAWRVTGGAEMLTATPFALARADVRSRVEQMISLSDDSYPAPRFARSGAYALGAALLVLAVLPALLGS
jgi:Zn-dependent protease with chaperone function